MVAMVNFFFVGVATLVFGTLSSERVNAFSFPSSQLISPTHDSKRLNVRSGVGRFGMSTTSSVNDSSSTGRSNNRNRRNRKPNVSDRTQEEAISLIQDIIKATLDAGPVAGPRRTLQAYLALTQTVEDFLPLPIQRPSIFSTSRRQQVESFSPPKALRKLFERMGATFIKLGQFIASSPTIFPKEYVLEFQKCLDATEPLEWSVIKKVIEDELGGPISKTYSYIDTKPLASASIAQVHAAKLRSTGQDVVIKVQKPGIDECLKADLGFVFVAARVLEFLQPDWERTSLSAVAGDIRTSMLEELDFEMEASNTEQFRQFLKENNLQQQAVAPKIYREYTTKKILTMERLFGVSMLDADTIAKVTKDPELGTEAIITALNIWSMSVVGMPFFHADVHAGNLLMCDDGRIGFIDFGIVGRVSEKTFNAVNELSAALTVGDYEAMAVALCNMGATDEKVNTKQFGNDLRGIMEGMNEVQTDVTISAALDGSIEGARVDIDESDITNLLLDVVDVTENNGLKLPREFGLLVKQSLYFDRYLKMLAPNVDVMNDSRVAIGGKLSDDKYNSVNGGYVNGDNKKEEVVIDV